MGWVMLQMEANDLSIISGEGKKKVHCLGWGEEQMSCLPFKLRITEKRKIKGLFANETKSRR
jgi:hypothetical protein